MQGDFSRWTFDPRDGYRAVLLQQGRVLLDADWNEQTQITARHDEVRTLDVVGRAGGPLDGAGFGVEADAGGPPAGVPWADLRITPGRYYVDGVLVEAAPPDDGGIGHPLADQPFLPKVGDLPGLPEPTADGRYAVLLDAWTQHVTVDDAPRLRESALGGPDTTTRSRTVWQVRLVPVTGSATCADVTDPVWGARTPPTMTAGLREVDPAADPCRISTSGGYRRLENQLYRVQVHDVAADGTARYLWSRENGSVVAGLVAVGPPSASAAAAGMDVELTLDRVGRDEELSIREGDVVEVTSTDRQLYGLPGHLATAGAPDGPALPVRWTGAGPTNLAALGGTPVVRRWDGPPRVADAAPDELDDAGIEVAFGAGDFRVGDHWLIPARTVRLVYGVSALSGTIEWPVDAAGDPAARPPLGPVHHVAVLGLLRRATASGAGRWTLVEDCRRLTPPLTDLVAIDLLGGDGQSAPAGQPLPEPVRVVVRNGGRPVVGARVRFATATGHLAPVTATPGTGDPGTLSLRTDDRGYAEVRWLLPTTGPATGVLTATRLDDGDDPVGAEVRVTGRREDAGGSACLVVGPDTDLVRLLADLSGIESLVLCLGRGTWELSEPAVLKDVGTVVVTGAGAGATLIRSAGASALLFVGCGEVQVCDLAVEVRSVEGEEVTGALTVERPRRALVERVRTRTSSGPGRGTAGILVSVAEIGVAAPERVTVRDCRIRSGHEQLGVVVVDGERIEVVGCEIDVVDDPTDEREDRFAGWLREPSFAGWVARRAVHPLSGDGELRVRRGVSHLVTVGQVDFGSEIDDPKGWETYLRGRQVGTVEEIQNLVRDDLTAQDRRSRFFDERTRFATWLHRVGREARDGRAASFGIRVTGSRAEEVRIRDNSVTDALHGIVVDLDVATGDEPSAVDKLWVAGNSIAPAVRPATGFVEYGILVGACRRLDVSSNTVTVPVTDDDDDEPDQSVVGLTCAGPLGVHAVAHANTFAGAVVGIHVRKFPEREGVRLRVARDNVCTTGPALVDESGLWRDEGNVSG